MASNPRILNLSNGHRVKRNQALGRVAQCISAWVEPNMSIRDLTLRECIEARSAQARIAVPLAPVELLGIIFEGPAASQAATLQERRLASEADRYCIASQKGTNERTDSEATPVHRGIPD